MNTTAIHQAMRLQKNPEEMAWLCFPDSDLPDGISDLLRVCSSEEQLVEFANTNGFEIEALRFALFNFIEKTMLNARNEDGKVIGTNKLASSQLQKFHYDLLMKIYDPELSLRPNAKKYSEQIFNAYQNLLNEQEKEQEIISISDYRRPPKSYNKTSQKAETQISNTQTAIAVISTIAIFSLVAMTGKFYGTSSPVLVTTNVVENISDTDTLDIMKVTSLKSNVTPAEITPSIKASSAVLQVLLKDLEVAYEKGDIDTIKPLLANAPDIQNQTDQQLNDKLETIFEITSERKMVLFNFDWTNATGKIEGKGKFISRYQLVGESKWLTREGNALVTAEKFNNNLKITQLILENNPIE